MGEVWNYVSNFEEVYNEKDIDSPLFFEYPESLKKLKETNDFGDQCYVFVDSGNMDVFEKW
jgi:histidyl-tRNA synthetase